MWDGSVSPSPRKMVLKPSSPRVSENKPKAINVKETDGSAKPKPMSIVPVDTSKKEKVSKPVAISRPLSSLKVATSFITIREDDPSLVAKVPSVSDRQIVLSILKKIDMKDTGTIMNATSNVENDTSVIIDNLLDFTFKDFDKEITENLDKILEMVKDDSPGFFSSLFGIASSITVKDKMKIIDGSVNELKYQIIRLKNRIGDLDSLFLRSREKLNDIQCYLTALEISSEWFLKEKEGFSELENQLTKSNLDIFDMRRERLLQLKVSLQKDPITILLSKDIIIGKINLIEATIFGLVHEWKVNLQLKSENKSNNLKEITSSLRESIERTKNAN